MNRKFNKIYTLFGILLIAALFISSSNNPPNGKTGAPGDGVCYDCHSSSNPNNFAGMVQIINFPTTINPNTTYNLTARTTFTAGSPSRAGFQAVVLNSSNTNAGSLSTSDPNVAITNFNSRIYAEHDPAINFSGNTAEWDFEWTAPTAANGTTITVYTSSILANNANGNSGDFMVLNAQQGTVMNTGTPPAAVATATNVSCFGGNDGTATAIASGGTPGYTYAWSNGGSGETISNLIAGTYTVTVTDNAALTATANATVTQPTPLTALIVSSTNVDCFGNSTGSATASSTGGTPGVNYFWSSGSNSATASNLSAGTYTVTATDANNCTSTQSVTISQPNALTVTTTQTNINCNGNNNGSATAIGIGGSGSGYSYFWSNGMTSQTISNLSPITYFVTVTDGNNCTQTSSVTITQPPAINIITTQTNVSCAGAGDGSATAVGSGGIGNLSYAWSNGGNTQMISNLTAATYTVTVTDQNNCTNTESITISEPGAISIVIAQVSHIDCNGNNNGSATASGAGGAGGLSYAWSTGANTATANNLSAGTHTVTVTDVNSCTNTESVNITEPPAIILTVTQTNINCNGANNGTATASGTGGVGNFSYNWSTGDATQMVNGLSPGTHTVTATDDNGCIKIEMITITEPSAVTVSTTPTNIDCNGNSNGAATASGNGGTGNISYNWSNGSNTETASNLSAGTYTVTATDENNCTQTETVTITEPSAINLTITPSNVDCNGNSNGSATASGNGGTGIISYNWSNGSNTETASNLSAGTYTVTATDENNCIQTESITITEPSAINLTTTTSNVDCNGNNNGSATASGNGGTGNISYHWSNGETTAMANNLTAGTYTVTATDENNCTQTSTVTITEPAILVSNASATGETAAGANDGTATTNPSGGTGNYVFIWNTGSTNAMISNLAPGNYTVTVTDNNNCTISETVNVSAFNCVVTLTVTSDDVSCNGGNDGTATADVANGAAPITYLWSTGSGENMIINLTAGTYTVTITDANNCPAIETVTISEPPPVTSISTLSPVLCNGGNDGTATADADGGVGGFSYLWSTNETTPMISGLTAGTYTYTATDGNGCSISETITITEPTALVVNASATGVTANGANDGTATANPSGGISGYTFLWSTGSTNQMISNLAPGDYTVTVTDNNGCTNSETVTVNDVGCAVSISTATMNVTCFGDENGSATATILMGEMPVTYAWSNGGTTATISNLSGGTYTVTVTDANNCPAIETVTIIEPDILVIVPGGQSVNSLLCNGDDNGVLEAIPMGGTLGYSYLWSTGSGESIINGLVAGSYTVTVTDANQCTKLIVFNVTEPSSIVVNATSTNETAAMANDGTATANPSGGTGNHTYNWSNSSTSQSISGLMPGTYTVTITDENNCTSTESVSVVPFGCALTATTATTDATCADAADGTATITPADGNPSYTFIWSSGGIAATETGLLPGTYTVTVNDASNCAITQMITVGFTDDVLPTVVTQDITVFLDATGNVNVSSSMIDGGSSDNCGISFIEVTPNNFDCDDLGVATVSVTVMDINGNVAQGTANVTVEDNIAPTIVCPTDIQIDECTGMVTYGLPAISDNCPNFVFFISGPASGTIFPFGTSTVSYDVQDIGGNSASCSFEVTIDHTLDVNTTAEDSPCFGFNEGVASSTVTGSDPDFDFLWNTGDTSAMIGALPPGTYTLTVTDNTGCSTTSEVEITEPDLLTIALENVTDESAPGANDGMINISIEGGVMPYTYSWTLDGNVVSTDEDPTGLTGGEYIVTVLDANGCEIISDMVPVGTMVGNEDVLLEKNIQLFPNPTSGLLYLDFTLPESLELEIMVYDITGKIVQHNAPQIIGQTRLEMNFVHQSGGMYFIKIQSEDGVWMRKLILQK